MKKFRFVCIALTILIVASTIPNAGLFNTKALSAATIHSEYPKLPAYIDEPQAQFPATSPSEATSTPPNIFYSESRHCA